jgi:hypothetical protein
MIGRGLLVLSLVFVGCTTVNKSAAVPPCHSDRRGGQVCGDATFNASVIAQIHKGQSRGDVRGIMGHDAERREIGALTESWGYMTSYENNMITWITFTDQRVSSLSHEAVVRD